MQESKWNDPRWLDFSSKLKQKRGWKCEKCGYVGGNLHAHHLAYSEDKNRDPWKYHERHMSVICAHCHAKEHRIRTIPDEECMAEAKVEKKNVLYRHPKCKHQYLFNAVSALTQKQAETLTSILTDLKRITERNITVSMAVRFVMETMVRCYEQDPNWVENFDRKQNFLEKVGSRIF